MPNYTLLLLDDAGQEVGELDCFAANPWLALEKSKKSIGRSTVELREGEHSYGRFRSAFPLTQVWELSPSLRAPPKA
jgi:hypothetical protein